MSIQQQCCHWNLLPNLLSYLIFFAGNNRVEASHVSVHIAVSTSRHTAGETILCSAIKISLVLHVRIVQKAGVSMQQVRKTRRRCRLETMPRSGIIMSLQDNEMY